MSLAKKCDHCGKFYEHYPIVNPGAYNAIIKIKRGLDGTIDFYGPTIDLCPDCMASFERLMKEGRNNG